MSAYFLSTEYISPAYYSWGIQNLHDSGNWGVGVCVFVVDSAILIQNPDQMDVISMNFATGTSPTETHGQYVMSLLSAPVNNWGSVGICPSSRLILANVDSSNNVMYIDSIVNALRYAASQSSIDIISLSIGTTTSDATLLSAINACYSAGKIILAAAGNQAGYGITYPAYYPGVVSVGSTSISGVKSSFNTINDAVCVFAPGENIQFVRANDSTGTIFTSQSGTSFACPFAAGAAALILSALRTSSPGATINRATLVQRLRGMFNLSCSVHSYVRTDNPCISQNSGNPLALDPMLMVPQTTSSNALSTNVKIFIAIIVTLFVTLSAVYLLSPKTKPLNVKNIMHT